MSTFRLALQPKQAQLLNIVEHSPYTRIGEGGSRGGGKSQVLRDIQIARRFGIPSTKGWLFRRTLPELRENHIEPMFAQYPALGEYWKAEERQLRFPNASTLSFIVAENEADILKRRGQDAMDIAVDESNLMRESEMRELGMCCRAPGYPDSQCKLIEGFNPGGIGHNRIKRLYIDRTFLSNEIPQMYYFLPMFAWDNITWSADSLAREFPELSPEERAQLYYRKWSDTERSTWFVMKSQYGRDLNALPEPTRSQMLLGNFDSFEGQVFGFSMMQSTISTTG